MLRRTYLKFSLYEICRRHLSLDKATDKHPGKINQMQKF